MYLMERGCKNSQFFFFEIVNDVFLIFSNISLINVFLKNIVLFEIAQWHPDMQIKQCCECL